jgi:hypothetical protein
MEGDKMSELPSFLRPPDDPYKTYKEYQAYLAKKIDAIEKDISDNANWKDRESECERQETLSRKRFAILCEIRGAYNAKKLLDEAKK